MSKIIKTLKILIVLAMTIGSVSLFHASNGLCGTADIGGYYEHKAAGDNYLKKEKFDSAVAEYEKALKLNPKSTVTLFNLAIADYSVKDLKGAVVALEKLVAISPNDIEAHYNLGCLKICMKDLLGSKASFEKAKACCHLNPRFTPLIHQGLEFLSKFRKLDSATQDLNLYFLEAAGLPPLSFAS